MQSAFSFSRPAATFACEYCEKQSSFRQRLDSDLGRLFAHSQMHFRSYECDHCGLDNLLRRPVAEWEVIDAG